MPKQVEVGRGEVVAETDLAICVELEGHDDEVWIPKSQISDDSEIWQKGDEGELVVNKWFAEKEGLV